MFKCKIQRFCELKFSDIIYVIGGVIFILINVNICKTQQLSLPLFFCLSLHLRFSDITKEFLLNILLRVLLKLVGVFQFYLI